MQNIAKWATSKIFRTKLIIFLFHYLFLLCLGIRCLMSSLLPSPPKKSNPKRANEGSLQSIFAYKNFEGEGKLKIMFDVANNHSQY